MISTICTDDVYIQIVEGVCSLKDTSPSLIQDSNQAAVEELDGAEEWGPTVG